MKTILYATDYSKNSVAALNYAHGIAEQMNSRLVVVHVFDNPTILVSEGVNQSFPDLEQTAFEQHRDQLVEFYEEHLGSGWKTPNVQLQSVENISVLKGILSVAEEWHAQIIIVGTRGDSVLREIIMGSTTKQLIENAPCPVMAIPSGAIYKAPKKIIYATAFEEEDVYAIKRLAEMARAFDATIKVVHIGTEKEYEGTEQMEWFRELLEEKVSYDKIDFKFFFSDDILNSLQMYIKETNADLVVMLERENKSILKKWFHTSLVKKMESENKVPLLSFREGNHQLFYFSAAL